MCKTMPKHDLCYTVDETSLIFKPLLVAVCIVNVSAALNFQQTCFESVCPHSLWWAQGVQRYEAVLPFQEGRRNLSTGQRSQSFYERPTDIWEVSAFIHDYNSERLLSY